MKNSERCGNTGDYSEREVYALPVISDVFSQTTVRRLRKKYIISTDEAALNNDFMYEALADIYPDMPPLFSEMRACIRFGIYRKMRQIGFARLITGITGSVILRDIYISPEYRLAGMGSWLLNCCLNHSSIKKSQYVIITNSRTPDFFRKNGFRSVYTFTDIMIFNKGMIFPSVVDTDLH